MSYFAFGDIDRGRGNVRDYYGDLGKDRADFVAGNIRHGADEIRAAVKAFEEIGADELILHPAIDDLVEIDRLAEVVL